MDDPDSAVFERLMASVDHPMFVLTARDGDQRVGCLAGFATKASIHPARFLILVAKRDPAHQVAAGAPVVVVHVLRADDEEIADRFGEPSSDGVDPFEGLTVVDGPARAPVVVGLDWFAGRVLRSFDTGDHVALLLAPHDGSAARASEPSLTEQVAGAMEPEQLE